jgi:hypothetical protein
MSQKRTCHSNKHSNAYVPHYNQKKSALKLDTMRGCMHSSAVNNEEGY